MTTPNWPKFASLTATPELLDFLSAMGIDDPPPEGRPRQFRAYRHDDQVISVSAETYRDSGRTAFIVCADGSSRCLSTPKAIRLALKIPHDTPTAKALSRWLRWWGMTTGDAPVAVDHLRAET